MNAVSVHRWRRVLPSGIGTEKSITKIKHENGVEFQWVKTVEAKKRPALGGCIGDIGGGEKCMTLLSTGKTVVKKPCSGRTNIEWITR